MQVTHFFRALYYLRRLEHQHTRILFLKCPLHLIPRNWSRYSRMFSRAQGIYGNCRLVLVVLAPIHKDFPGTQLFFHFRNNQPLVGIFEDARDRMSEFLRFVIIGRSV